MAKVAFFCSDFIRVYGAGNEYYRPSRIGDCVAIDVVLAGKNMMRP